MKNYLKLIAISFAMIFLTSCGEDSPTEPKELPSGGNGILYSQTTYKVEIEEFYDQHILTIEYKPKFLSDFEYNGKKYSFDATANNFVTLKDSVVDASTDVYFGEGSSLGSLALPINHITLSVVNSDNIMLRPDWYSPIYNVQIKLLGIDTTGNYAITKLIPNDLLFIK